ncbi:hypothetical protein CHARACLAT_013687 [Characodon lateralis]|uniref:Uncharacterized protein n=1 Tax=Characodon lateralis TaxID=208331 RepID=A0ABU7DAS6_9TELE|nr:hypothetical protein [Characodon lateralis]
MVHSDSMSPTSPRIWSKLSWRWELNTSLAEGSARHSQETLYAWACQDPKLSRNRHAIYSDGVLLSALSFYCFDRFHGAHS